MKLYADEEGADIVRALRPLVISAIARVEVPSALWRKHRRGELSADDARILTAEFEADYLGTDEVDPRFIVAVISNELLDEAARLAAVHGLHAYDAVQLASARAARDADEGCAGAACFDEALRVASAAEGFALIPA